MLAPQLRFYAAARAGMTAIIDTSSGAIAAWVVHDGERLRARGRGSDWITEPADTVPQLVHLVAAAVTAR